MHYLGIDLAWGERNPTGLAVLDEAGRLVHLATARTDEQIVAELSPYVGPGCRAGIDAPLVVVNPTGSRPAEKALSADFRRFEAGAHPANTGFPWFTDGPRGARVATLLGLEPHVTALEVYPHAATVALFGLERTLKYKAKPGRDLILLRAELGRLMDLVAGVVDVGDPQVGWSARRAGVAAASRKSQVKTAEDPIDAVVCALVARIADREPDRVRTYGDPATGQIVTPRLPGDCG